MSGVGSSPEERLPLAPFSQAEVESDSDVSITQIWVCARPLSQPVGRVGEKGFNQLRHCAVILDLSNGNRWYSDVNCADGMVELSLRRLEGEISSNHFPKQMCHTVRGSKSLVDVSRVSTNWYGHEYAVIGKNCQDYVDEVALDVCDVRNACETLFTRDDAGYVHTVRQGIVAFSSFVRDKTTTTTTQYLWDGVELGRTLPRSQTVREIGFLTNLSPSEAAKQTGKFSAGGTIIITSAFVVWDGVQYARGKTDGKQFLRNTGKNVVSGAAGAGGSAAGAALGTLLFPGVGTVLGAVIGSVAASLAASATYNHAVDAIVG